MHPKEISILDYSYDLPDEKIALYPLAQRDASRLLVYKNKKITEDIYRNIGQHLPQHSLLVFNNTKVIPARILFTKPSGGVIEIFCLEPYETISDYASIMSRTQKVRWKCMIGGASKWKGGPLEKKIEINGRALTVTATLTEKLPGAYVVELSWTPEETDFVTVLAACGDIPLPPYIKRKTEGTDKDRYQTIYAAHNGSVAAPTAGLHFTSELFARLDEKNIQKEFVTLHVGAGTFKPVKAAVMEAHEMHAEWIDVTTATIENLLARLNDPVVAVGTTSLRTLESLYWLGVKAAKEPGVKQLQLTQWEVYDTLNDTQLTAREALQALLQWTTKNNSDRLFTQTQLLIAPGYRFKLVHALVTNFHQPQSTLLLLVAAAVGPHWKTIYNHALQNDFRFLSYGDGSLLFIHND